MVIRKKNYKNENLTAKLSIQQRRYYSFLGAEDLKPVHPIANRIFGHALALMINQLLYWDGKQNRKDGFIWKTEKDFEFELGITPARQKRAIQDGKKYGFLEVERRGMPGKRHYRIDVDKLITATIREANKAGIVLPKHVYQSGEFNRTITNTTQRSTTRDNGVQSIAEILRL